MSDAEKDALNVNSDVESLVDRAVDGDTEAFGRLYDIYADRIYRHIYYRTANVEDARDMTQEVFARAWQSLPRYRRTSTPFLGWLFTISHNRVIDYYRKKKDYAYLNAEVSMDVRGRSPEQSAEQSFDSRMLRRAILQLQEDQQRVIVMTFIDGLAYGDIAAVINKSEGNVRVIVHRALKKLRLILDKEKD